MIRWRHFLHPSLVVRRLSPEVEDLKRRYEDKGGDFDDVLLEFVYPLRIPYRRLTGRQRRVMGHLMESIYAALEEQGFPVYLRASCEDLVDALILIGCGAIDPGPAHLRRGRRGRPPAAASRAGGVNLIIATVAQEFRCRFRAPHWEDIRKLLCFIAPDEFQVKSLPESLRENLRKRAKSIPDEKVRTTHARYFS